MTHRTKKVRAMNLKDPTGPRMTLGNMRKLGVRHLIAFSTNDSAAKIATGICVPCRLDAV
jgi:hypothetical protein